MTQQRQNMWVEVILGTLVLIGLWMYTRQPMDPRNDRYAQGQCP